MRSRSCRCSAACSTSAPTPTTRTPHCWRYLAKGRRLRAGYLSLTRGDGGQNLIGTEQGETLGAIRTQELLAARRVDGAEQWFTRAVDFGYSKTAEETLRIWGHDAVLSDIVWVIRSFRPDVIITRFPENGDGGHGHHTASATLAREAFVAAADPKRFPEQLAFVQPWQANEAAVERLAPGRADTDAHAPASGGGPRHLRSAARPGLHRAGRHGPLEPQEPGVRRRARGGHACPTSSSWWPVSRRRRT